MHSSTVASKTLEVRRQQVRVDVPRFPVDIRGASIPFALNCSDPLPSKALNRAERDRQASLDFLHRLVMGAEGD